MFVHLLRRSEKKTINVNINFIYDDLIMVHETYLSERDNQGKLKLLLSYKSRTLPVYSGKHILSGENVIFS